jgi:hypothetical protein
MTAGYVEPIYLQPLYQQRLVYGNGGCPFTCSPYRGTVSYEKGICPVTERMYGEELMLTNICHADITPRDLEDTITAIHKVLEHAREV